MKILWFTNIPMPPLMKKLGLVSGGSGYWMYALLENLKENENLDLSVACVYPSNFDIEETIEGIDYYLIKQKKSRLFHDNELKYLKNCLDIIEKIKPDIIHIHGTERFYGLLSKHVTNIPVIISLQGLIGPYSEWFNYYGKISIRKIIGMETLRSLLNGSSPFRGLQLLRGKTKQELEIIINNYIFLGRTDWGRAYIHAHNPEAQYYCVQRIIRLEFWKKRWNLRSAQKHRIFISNCRGTRSGADVMIRAFEIVEKKYPDVMLYVAGANALARRGYHKYLSKLTEHFKDSIIFTGYLEASELAEQLYKSHVFVHPTYIDNSPNSLAEAQIVGTPVIASCTGGKMSMVDHNKTGLLFPNGDYYLLADRIMQAFKSDELVRLLGLLSIYVGCTKTWDL